MSVFISKSRSGPTIHSYESKRNRGLNVCQLLCTFCVSIELEIKLKEIERRRKKTTSIICDSNLFFANIRKEKKDGNDGYFYLFYGDDVLFGECQTNSVGGKLILKIVFELLRSSLRCFW